MIDKLKTFVSKHKQEFDTEKPKQDLWQKIDAKLEVKNSSAISSSWLSKLKYLGLSASILLVVLYFISKNLNNSSASELAQNRKDSALSNSEEWVKANQNRSETNSNANSEGKLPENTNSSISSNAKEEQTKLTERDLVKNKKDSVLNSKPLENISEPGKTKPEEIVHPIPKVEDPNNIATKKEENVITKNNKNGIIPPAEPEKMNSYNAVVYESTSLCDILRIYKFPGQVSVDGTPKTMSCSRLENVGKMKAIWIKGNADKKITLELGEGFKNIKLIKADGRELLPEAISHYYKGLGVISGYKGKYFDIVFKNKVELILFFKDVEEGDKIVIDEAIEAVVKNQP